MTVTKNTGSSSPRAQGMGLLSLSALGVVFGDIGTSPLYTLKTVLALTGQDRHAIMGSLSLIVWTLIIVTTVKYVNFAMRVDNNGEGGILALMSLLNVKTKPRPALIALGLIGAALIYGDGAITPAISVLSAVEGLNIIAPSFERYVLPASVVILVALFSFQYKGTAHIGKTFGPIMALWFLTIAALGIWGITHHPAVLVAINPYYGMDYLLTHGKTGFLVLGGVFLCVTGAEALYADMGHFGARPIRLAWYWLVFPSLILNYAGQAALVLEGTPTTDNIFYRLCPQACLIPLVVLATVATIIASQSIITGAFSMTRQAITLGWLPRLHITQTSAEGYGQIYVRAVNWLLMLATVGLTIGFRKSDNLAAAYGIAVSATMLATSVLLFIAMREIWKWGWLKAGIVAATFIVIDTAFFTANLSKFAEGGYMPIAFAAIVYALMYSWHKGSTSMKRKVEATVVPLKDFLEKVKEQGASRVAGTAIFLTHTQKDTPPVMYWHVTRSHALHEKLFILRVETLSSPWLHDNERLTVTEIAPNVWRAVARYGFMERPHIPQLLEEARLQNCMINLHQVTYYVGHETVIPGKRPGTLHYLMESAYAFMQRNCMHISDYLGLPSDKVVEIGRQIKL